MCARFYVTREKVSDSYDPWLIEEENRQELVWLPEEDSGMLRPGDTASVFARARSSGQPRAYPMHWGFTTEHGLVFNARSESLQTRPMFRDSFQSRRCLIPMTGYYEWDHRQKPLIRYRFEPQHRDGRCCFAGLYRFEDSRLSFTILTRVPGEELAAFHDRMPVILSGSGASAWLFGSPEQAMRAAETSLTGLRYGVDA